MYSLSQIMKGLRDPTMAIQELNRAYYDLVNDTGYNDGGVDVFREDWDNLIVLDACRYDEFEDRADLPGDLQARESLSSMTHEWIRANFTERELYDTVYVSANGRFAHQKDDVESEVHEFVGLWDDDHRYGDDKIAPPEMVTEHAKEAAAEYPNKRLLVHYLQPHQPYIGPSGDQFERDQSLHEMMQTDGVSTDLLRRAYRENLDLVLDDVADLLNSLSGKTVVTSDHGELLGEREFPIPIRRYGHPSGIYTEPLVKVPWLVVENGDRKEIVSEEPDSVETYDQERIEDHLEDLGYKA